MTQIPVTLPPQISQTAWQWAKKNLFSSWFNTLLTIICIWVLYLSVSNLWIWTTTKAQWEVVSSNLRLLLVGLYPVTEFWRLWGVLVIAGSLAGISWGLWGRFSRTVAISIGSLSVTLAILLPVETLFKGLTLAVSGVIALGFTIGQQCKKFEISSLTVAIAWFISLPISLWLVGGNFGLTAVDANVWNGLVLTLLVAISGITFSFPLGILLALGRQSTLPVIKLFCTCYIELVRGLPLIGILFMAQVMLPLFLPAGLEIDRVLRAIAAFVLFSAAYLAENVRGGLQSIPKGQAEAARALGLNIPLTIALIILPQALKASIPAIVGQFIGLFKDTSLVAIVGLVDLMGIARTVLSQPEFIGRYAEVYLFVAIIYWVFCFSMSQASQKLERKLHN
ncbi:MAG: amino acid ABC transporter permease [Pseudanabaena sp.]|jgi:general L-amino acid transport system permease protein|uniref:amino acid ABC transporter permease n=1 Tax=Pseudanabaena mucicola TaxID=71190 RepID=UPI002574B351|nr:amino acid ABC transporter permease [Pseudanabaena mucicola]MCA6584941.1 amino acid ABC transporter permease [Pseudanabaena sp. M051S1SP1A06QC]MCA6588775.1 amino acid ABC transporter permease [Pseudanabaena sp. M109S1SP1A06QC]MCA6594990.1 amino acid ABC transporter permease [Pseudanabaena sp. M046S1SP1A06QC]MCA6606643.1 amino acid ABC transporter permease [Pseudanabaena sp. M007S1SP1A06QC]MCA6612931.1 amino acid ABC transporter permease [Pseudanabaena sp. M158S2SP1A06QC]MCA6613990.1 amino 